MRVGIVGGVERAESHYERVAQEAGIEVLFHRGNVGGRGREALGQLIERCDLLVIVTDVNSHGAVQFARKRLRQRGRTPLLIRRFGLAHFTKLVEALAARAHNVNAPWPLASGDH